jgi:copper chaperone CopZ
MTMPQGSRIAWAGEVLGGPLENDPTVEPVIEHGENGYDIVSLTLTKALRAQVELTAPGILVQDGTHRSLRIGYLPVDEVGTVSVAALVPAGGVIETATPGATTSPGPSNGTIVALETSAVPGAEVTLDIRYTQAARPASTTTGGASNATSILIIALVVAAFVFVLVMANKRAKRTAIAEEDEAGPDADGGDDIAAAVETGKVTVPGSDAQEDAPPVAVPEARRGLTPQTIIIAVVAVILGGAVFVMASGEAPGTTRSTNEYTYKVLTDADGNTTLTVPIRLSEADPAHESSHVFDAVAGVAGVRSVKVIYAGPSAEIEYDSSRVDEATIRGALSAGGYPPLS